MRNISAPLAIRHPQSSHSRFVYVSTHKLEKPSCVDGANTHTYLHAHIPQASVTPNNTPRSFATPSPRTQNCHLHADSRDSASATRVRTSARQGLLREVQLGTHVCVCMYLSSSMYLSVEQSVNLSAVSIYASMYLSTHLPILSDCLSV